MAYERTFRRLVCPQRDRRNGFTLIELLVVISIIALLMAILIPTLSRAKKQAAAGVCLSNQRHLVLAWIMYAQDNDDNLIGGHDGHSASPSQGYDWVELPQTEDGTVVSGASATLEDKKRGCERGALFPYARDVDLYHCPGDRRHRTEMTHRSYGIPGSMNGDVGTGADSWLTQQWGYPSYKKLTGIKNPGIKYVFLESGRSLVGPDRRASRAAQRAGLRRRPLRETQLEAKEHAGNDIRPLSRLHPLAGHRRHGRPGIHASWLQPRPVSSVSGP